MAQKPMSVSQTAHSDNGYTYFDAPTEDASLRFSKDTEEFFYVKERDSHHVEERDSDVDERESHANEYDSDHNESDSNVKEHDSDLVERESHVNEQDSYQENESGLDDNMNVPASNQSVEDQPSPSSVNIEEPSADSSTVPDTYELGTDGSPGPEPAPNSSSVALSDGTSSGRNIESSASQLNGPTPFTVDHTPLPAVEQPEPETPKPSEALTKRRPRPPTQDQSTMTFQLTTPMKNPNATLDDYLHHIYDTKQRLAKDGRAVTSTPVVTKLVRKVMSTAIMSLREEATFRHRVMAFNLQEHLHQLGPNEYMVKVILEDLYPGGTCQLLSGVIDGLPVGESKLKLNSMALTPVELGAVRKSSKYFLDGDFLSPNKVKSWFLKGMLESIGRQKGELIHDHSILVKSTQEGNKSFTITLMAVGRDCTEIISIHITPLLLIPGLRSPVPTLHLQHERHKKKDVVEWLRQRIERGVLKVMSLEGSTQSTWKLKYTIAERELHDYILQQYDTHKEAKIFMEVLTLMEERNPEWHAFTPEFRINVLLHMLKKEGLQTTAGDYFLVFVASALKALRAKRLPSFFQEKMNILEGVSGDNLVAIEKCFSWLVGNITEQPKYSLHLCFK